MSGVIGELTKFVGLWYAAGSVASAISISLILLTGGIMGVATELITTSIISSLPFPINFLVSWYIDPIALVLSLFFQCLVFFGLLHLGNR
jgi:hypothetical protein